jgi:hypothetical protein
MTFHKRSIAFQRCCSSRPQLGPETADGVSSRPPSVEGVAVPELLPPAPATSQKHEVLSGAFAKELLRDHELGQP